jgi:acyl-CoA reductase-like NAD-dependent aldehyde dehydrogenase
MGTRIAMACYDTIRETATKAGIIETDYTQVSSIYESGMIDVLSQIAIMRLLELDDQGRREYPAEYDQAVEEQAELLTKITDALPEKHKELINDLEDLETRMQLIEMDDQFIRGFIEGYRYLRNLNSSYHGPLLLRK